MSRKTETLDPAYFEALYAADPDPWKFASSDYEKRKYALTLAALPRAQYDAALEVGCSIGVLTRALAVRCDRLVAIDAAETALRQARERNTDRPTIGFARMVVPGDWPEGRFDLILLSEVVYYLTLPYVQRLARRISDGLAPGGDVVLVHWTGETDYPLSGDDAATALTRALAGIAHPIRADRHPEFRLDILRRLQAA